MEDFLYQNKIDLSFSSCAYRNRSLGNILGWMAIQQLKCFDRSSLTQKPVELTGK